MRKKGMKNIVRKRRIRLTAAAIGMMSVLGAVQVQAEENADILALFYTYVQDNVVMDYCDPANILASWQLEYKSYDGFLAMEQSDLDWDGVNELLAIRICPDEEGSLGNRLLAEVYEYEGDRLQRVAQTTLAENMLEFDQDRADVFWVTSDYGTYLCCEDRERAALLADGTTWTLRIYSFDGTDFVQQAEHSIIGSAWESDTEQPVFDTLNSLGLYPSDLVDSALADQFETTERLCSIDRYWITDYPEISAFLENPDGDAMQYGETIFESQVNDLQNKLQGDSDFASVVSETAQTAASSESTSSEDYILPDSDSRYLTEADLEGLTEYEILLARNEIYARRGRMFQNEELDQYFRSKSWYQPTVEGSDFTEEYAANVFNDYERYNIDLIVTYEKAHNLNQG